MISPVKIWRNQKKIREILNQNGNIVSFTQVFVPPQGFESQAPYVVAIVKLESGRRYTAQLVDYDKKNLRVGQKVVTVLRRTRSAGDEGIIPYGIKFKPLI
ncbi:MAG: hypothetical protein UV73_C0004G0023 [Candidatus Gottesmanbacteria bacterium GW2011_GWA2_43_14]|uniref:ChsH2 C-terminal OB-fold domain-containing protein n=1 Tax=Candidatus Gottesmanbacteria bacterium GW2011_GWA2_43_14 TaxID=1618443 RepID=A0A0G1FS81_9BACT|nr:MAG: hypothetical protein UV73_C0004G0023 [Candidatus Gottesmanbacteria bacterium GW2011_GWA2_43_14]